MPTRHPSRSEGRPPAFPDRQTMPNTLSGNRLATAIAFLQHRFHVVQATDYKAHLRLIIQTHCQPDTKIHLHLPLFLGNGGLNDRRGLLWGDIGSR